MSVDGVVVKVASPKPQSVYDRVLLLRRRNHLQLSLGQLLQLLLRQYLQLLPLDVVGQCSLHRRHVVGSLDLLDRRKQPLPLFNHRLSEHLLRQHDRLLHAQ